MCHVCVASGDIYFGTDVEKWGAKGAGNFLVCRRLRGGGGGGRPGGGRWSSGGQKGRLNGTRHGVGGGQPHRSPE